MPSKNSMCLEKRHHNMSLDACSHKKLSEAQGGGGGGDPPLPPIGLPSEHVTLSMDMLFMVSIAVGVCLGTQHLRPSGVTSKKKKKLSARRYAAHLRGGDIVPPSNPPPLEKS